MKEEHKKTIIQTLRKRIDELMKEKDILISFIDELNQNQKFGTLNDQEDDFDKSLSQFSLN